jgi:hypothetical protein
LTVLSITQGTPNETSAFEDDRLCIGRGARLGVVIGTRQLATTAKPGPMLDMAIATFNGHGDGKLSPPLDRAPVRERLVWEPVADFHEVSEDVPLGTFLLETLEELFDDPVLLRLFASPDSFTHSLLSHCPQQLPSGGANDPNANPFRSDQDFTAHLPDRGGAGRRGPQG